MNASDSSMWMHSILNEVLLDWNKKAG